MLYLEDYLEMIEHLPQELRDRFTEMRELDLQVQNSMDSLEKQCKSFFQKAKFLEPTEKEAEYEVIRKEYYKTLEDADEKVQLANHMQELVLKYHRRLEQETHKFKMELEADNMGITEILEKRSQDMDVSGNSLGLVPKETFSSRSYSFPQRHSFHEKQSQSQGLGGLSRKEEVGAPPPKRLSLGTELASSQSAPALPWAGGTAIAAAASQAIAATQQMQQGRRTASLKASYEAIHSAGAAELAGAAQTAIAAIQDTHKKNHKRKGGGWGSGSGSGVASPAALSPQPDLAPSNASDRDSNASSDTYDPNEPRYCVCNQVAFGMMVACDNRTCPYEWYHYPCVGITEKPKGKWYCPHCTGAMKRRNRKN